MGRRHQDARQLTLEGWVDLSATAEGSARNLSLGASLAGWVSEALAGRDRHAVAADMSRLTGDRIAKTVGCRVLLAHEHVYYRLGRLQEQKRQLEDQERYLSRLTDRDEEGGS